ncbi:hypothetical protein GBA52_019588 [Prunus armeniaca]|nr:hypothetical protein GBA52_019588 [Prunus armeniaca]
MGSGGNQAYMITTIIRGSWRKSWNMKLRVQDLNAYKRPINSQLKRKNRYNIISKLSCNFLNTY